MDASGDPDSNGETEPNDEPDGDEPAGEPLVGDPCENAGELFIEAAGDESDPSGDSDSEPLVDESNLGDESSGEIADDDDDEKSQKPDAHALPVLQLLPSDSLVNTP